ncbi:MAG: PH domain-containing protein [Candidatus Aenigmarchaeota archaeon]|nr:PH domain-containing protein [Candidatus Aenigmarchaeota archaeon]
MRIGEDLKPALQLKSLYYTYAVSFLLFILIIIYLPVLVFAPLPVIIGVTIYFVLPVLLIFFFGIYWIMKYYHTIIYKLTGSEMTWRRGVWFKKTGVVPYNRITNVDIEQGPVSRKFRIASIKIQTAGYSGPHQRSSEIRIDGMKNFEELREYIISLVKGKKPVAVETYEEDIKGSDVLKELVRIRKLLERRR